MLWALATAPTDVVPVFSCLFPAFLCSGGLLFLSPSSLGLVPVPLICPSLMPCLSHWGLTVVPTQSLRLSPNTRPNFCSLLSKDKWKSRPLKSRCRGWPNCSTSLVPLSGGSLTLPFSSTIFTCFYSGTQDSFLILGMTLMWTQGELSELMKLVEDLKTSSPFCPSFFFCWPIKLSQVSRRFECPRRPIEAMGP